jgi:hypothetical protein
MRPAIITSDAPATADCAGCGAEVFTQAGPALVDLESSSPLCGDCGMECAPELLALVRFGEAALLCAAMLDFTPRYEFAPELLALVRLGEAALLCAAMLDFTPRYEFAPASAKVC